ncbi:MAG: M20/M25/M40 family metallo-hydrolase [Cytophagales bacterium]|nr:M20/M25/M40 family metallo-hydrolase [Cytophagales bacterium]
MHDPGANHSPKTATSSVSRAFGAARKKTKERLLQVLLQANSGLAITPVAHTGFVATSESGQPGPHLMLRCDMDALPLSEARELPYRSQNPGCAHLCGHDGHMALVVAAFVRTLLEGSSKGKLSLLAQPAEETGQGAAQVIASPAFQALKPDFIFGWHNLPGFPLGQLVYKGGVFASASCGLTVEQLGKTSHAAEPENGLSPREALAQLMIELPTLANQAPSVCLPSYTLCLATAHLG